MYLIAFNPIKPLFFSPKNELGVYPSLLNFVLYVIVFVYDTHREIEIEIEIQRGNND